MPAQMTVNVDWDRSAGRRGSYFYGYFLEHFHRQVYGGVFDPASPLADENGFRADVLDLIRRLAPAVIRWPGGCFASAYHWQHGVGEPRLPSYDKAWRVEEPNAFGTAEFIALCRAVGAEPYLCGNAGTGSPEELSDWLEYCNLTGGSRWARLRAEHGHPDPFDVRLWSVGNENYGFWEVGETDPASFARYAREAARMLRRVDDRVILAAPAMVDFEWDTDLVVDWNLELLRTAGEQLDLVAIHGYAVLKDGAGYLEALAHIGFAQSRLHRMQQALGLLGLEKKVKIAFDEWNPRAWNFPGFDGRTRPDLTQWDRNDDNSSYTMADAILHASFLNTCLTNCDSVAMTNLSPLVNARGPIFTHETGVVLRPTYHVCELYSAQLAAEVLDSFARIPDFEAQVAGETITLPHGDFVVTADRDAGSLALSLVNLHPAEPLRCRVWVPGRMLVGEGRLSTLTGAHPDSFNDVTHPDDVAVSTTAIEVAADNCVLTLPPHSVSTLQLATTAGPIG
jgi:alpha-N-arabinofuranosidase